MVRVIVDRYDAVDGLILWMAIDGTRFMYTEEFIKNKKLHLSRGGRLLFFLFAFLVSSSYLHKLRATPRRSMSKLGQEGSAPCIFSPPRFFVLFGLIFQLFTVVHLAFFSSEVLFFSGFFLNLKDGLYPPRPKNCP